MVPREHMGRAAQRALTPVLLDPRLEELTKKMKNKLRVHQCYMSYHLTDSTVYRVLSAVVPIGRGALGWGVEGGRVLETEEESWHIAGTRTIDGSGPRRRN